MLFPEEDTPLLKAWIVKRIENTSDADSDVLADYMIALLKHDGPVDAVRALCEEEIPMFLTEDSKAFLDDVFQTLTYKSYRPGAPPPPSKPAELPNGPQTAVQLPQATSSGDIPAANGQTQSRKRGFRESNAADFASRRINDIAGDRTVKQAKRGGRRGNRGGYDGPMPFNGMPSFDPNNPMETLMQMQAFGLFPGMPDSTGWANSSRKQRCRDFDRKGFCSRGSTCPYEHGFAATDHGSADDYDPTNAGMGLDLTSFPMGPFALFPHSKNGRGGRRKGRAGKKRTSRASFSADGPVHDRSQSKIVVENIPEESLSEDSVRAFFSQFGQIEQVSMQPHKHLAVVEFDQWDSANAAYRSPKVIFDNRFVKVFWYREQSHRRGGTDGPNGENSIMTDANTDAFAEEHPFDMEEFQRRQEEAQKLHDERQAKKTAVEQKQQELLRQHHDLLETYKQETEKLQTKIAEKNGGTTDGGGAAASGTEMLKAKLAALEQEAKMLGLDPDFPDADAAPFTTFDSRGRGRGATRGRGYMPRRRGAFRGQEGRHAAYAQYSIDNRPKKLSVTGVDFTQGENDEVLRHFLLNLGEFESVEASPDVTYVSFQDRKTAERFYNSLQGKALPGIEGTLDLTWSNVAPIPSAMALAKNFSDRDGGRTADGPDVEEAGGLLDDDDGGRDGYQREEGELDEGEDPGGRERREMNMDYEVADEVPWDP